MRTQEELTHTKNDASMVPPGSGTSLINVGAAERILSVASGVALATLGMRNIRKVSSWPLLLSGGYMMLRGATGYCPVNTALHRNNATKKADAVEASGTYVVNKPRQEVYAFWRQLENLPSIMKHLAEVKQLDEKYSSWKAVVPGGIATISWESEIIEDQPGEYLSWSSMPGSTLDNAGSISFMDAPGHATEIKVRISYRLPGGDVGSLAAKLVNPFLQDIILGDLEQFKISMERDDLLFAEKQRTKKSGR